MQTEKTIKEKTSACMAYLKKFFLFLSGVAIHYLYFIITITVVGGNTKGALDTLLAFVINLAIIIILYFRWKRVITSKIFFIGYYLGATLMILLYGFIFWLCYALKYIERC